MTVLAIVLFSSDINSIKWSWTKHCPPVNKAKPNNEWTLIIAIIVLVSSIYIVPVFCISIYNLPVPKMIAIVGWLNFASKMNQINNSSFFDSTMPSDVKEPQSNANP